MTTEQDWEWLSFDEAIALKTEIERDPCYEVTDFHKRPCFQKPAVWDLAIGYQLVVDGKLRYSYHHTKVRTIRNFQRFQQRMAEQTARDQQRYPKKTKEATQ